MSPRFRRYGYDSGHVPRPAVLRRPRCAVTPRRPLLAAATRSLAVGSVLPPAASPGRRRPPPDRRDGKAVAEHSLRGAGHRRELLLRHGRPVRERRHGQRHGRPRQRPAGLRLRPDQEGLLQRRRPQGPARRSSTTSQGLGTDSIWLTPSFKNKAVQLEDGPSAGYHGYWITDFTQIDPHLGTNADLRDAGRRPRTPAGMKVFFDIITNHTADVIGYQEGARRPYVSKDAVALPDGRRAAPFDDRDYAGTHTLPGARPGDVLPLHPVLDASETEPQGPGLAQRRDALPQPRRHDVHRRELAVRRLLRPRRPLHREPDGRRRHDRHLPRPGSRTSASTASGSTR